jgi:hypothetical protein
LLYFGSFVDRWNLRQLSAFSNVDGRDSYWRIAEILVSVLIFFHNRLRNRNFGGKRGLTNIWLSDRFDVVTGYLINIVYLR